MLKNIVLSFSILFLLSATVLSVSAQSPEAQVDVVVLDATISSVQRKAQASATIAELRGLYKSQIEVYRTSEQQYNIAKEQHARLQTLSSLEEAVRATREALLNRSRVLVTYTQLITVTLEDIPGVDLAQKQRALVRLENVEEKLLKHQDAILNTQTREQIAVQADVFAAMQKELEAALYLGLALISQGNVQTVYDQALIVHRDIQNFHLTATASALVDAERQRAHAETTRNFGLISEQLSTILVAVVGQSEEFDAYNKSTFGRMLDDLEAPYIALTQLIGYLEELTRL